jgi:hypothetical protein
MQMQDTSRDKGYIGVEVCPFGESVSDEQSDATKTRHTRSRSLHVIIGHGVCGCLVSVRSCCFVGAQNLAIQGKTDGEKQGLIIQLPTHPTNEPAHSLP